MQIRTMQRREKKYLIGKHEAALILGRVKATLRADPHNGPTGYKVRSLYFDTVFDEDFWDRINGLHDRRKIRLRLYPPNLDIAHLEMKEKSGQEQRKRSLRMNKKDAETMAGGKTDVLLGYENDFATELYLTMNREGYVPRGISEYNRMAFFGIANDIRITFDSSLRGAVTSEALFKENLPASPVLSSEDVVLEVKYKNFLLGYVRDILGDNCKIEQAVSKYSMGREMVL